MLRELYPNLAEFFSAWFPDAPLEGMSEEDVIKEYKAVGDPDFEKVGAQLLGLLALKELPIEEISDLSNRYFESQEHCRGWLRMVQSNLV